MTTKTKRELCNQPAYWYAPSDGFLACECHAQPNMVMCSEMGPAPYGKCQHVTGNNYGVVRPSGVF